MISNIQNNKRLITREIIHDSYTLTHFYSKNVYTKNDIISFANRWHTVFTSFNLQKGDAVTYIGDFDGLYLSFFIAACEFGLTFCAFASKSASFITEHNRAGFGIKFIATISDVIDEWQPFLTNISVFDVDELMHYPEATSPDIDSDPCRPIYISFTSGTTGPPTVVTHDHTTLITASYKSVNLFYNPTGTTITSVMVNHLHHAGTLSIQFIPSLIVGASCYYVFYDDLFISLESIKPNICVLFKPQYRTLKQKHKQIYDTIDLSYIDVVLTGGSVLEEEFLGFLLSRGVSAVYDVYGATQALVPVLYSKYTSTDLIDNFDSKFKDLGLRHRRPIFTDIADGWEYVLDNDTGELLLTGDALCINVQKTPYYKTGDIFNVVDGQLTYRTRYFQPMTTRGGIVFDPMRVFSVVRSELQLPPESVGCSMTQDGAKNITFRMGVKDEKFMSVTKISLKQINDIIATHIHVNSLIDFIEFKYTGVDLGAIK